MQQFSVYFLLFFISLDIEIRGILHEVEFGGHAEISHGDVYDFFKDEIEVELFTNAGFAL